MGVQAQTKATIPIPGNYAGSVQRCRGGMRGPGVTPGSRHWTLRPGTGNPWRHGRVKVRARVRSRDGGAGFAGSTVRLGSGRPAFPLHLRIPRLTWLWQKLQLQGLGERQQPSRRGRGWSAGGPWWAVRWQWTVVEPRSGDASAGTEARAPKR